jgi:hypothetical protein
MPLETSYMIILLKKYVGSVTLTWCPKYHSVNVSLLNLVLVTTDASTRTSLLPNMNVAYIAQLSNCWLVIWHDS